MIRNRRPCCPRTGGVKLKLPIKTVCEKVSQQRPLALDKFEHSPPLKLVAVVIAPRDFARDDGPCVPVEVGEVVIHYNDPNQLRKYPIAQNPIAATAPHRMSERVALSCP